MQGITICAKCQHFLTRGDIWYDQFCGASPRAEAIDYVTGIRGYVGRNDLGNTYVDTQRYEYARNVNTDGHCPMYTEKA